MEGKPLIRECEFCLVDATCLCFKCMSYYCDSCFKLVHNNEKRKFHKKEKIDYFVPIETKCPEHNFGKMDLFCLDEKSNSKILFIFLFYSSLLCLLPFYEYS